MLKRVVIVEIRQSMLRKEGSSAVPGASGPMQRLSTSPMALTRTGTVSFLPLAEGYGGVQGC